MVSRLIPIALAIFLVTGCARTVPVDTFCLTHTQADFTPTRQTFNVMTDKEKSNTLKILKEGEKRCDWKPPSRG